jgi:glycosyl transferase family 87
MKADDSIGRWRAALMSVATVNLIVGVALSFRGGRDGDLFQVVRWAGEWVHGLDPYALADAGVDYPPWALVMLSPLAWVPNGVLTAFWIAANLGIVAWMVTRLSRWSDAPRARQTLLAALLLCAASLRTLNQFSVLSFALAIAGAANPSRAIGGSLIGLSFFKPQIGGALALWIWLRGQRGRVLTGVAVVLALMLVFSARAGVDPLTVTREYAASLSNTYGDLSSIPGHTDLRSALTLYAPSLDPGLSLSLALLVLLLVPLGVALWRSGGALPAGDLEVAAFCGVVSLLATRHLSYDLLLLLPLLVAWRVVPFTERPPTEGRAQTVAFWTIAALLVIEVPSWYRRLLEPAGLTGLAFLTELDRALCVAVWVLLCATLSPWHTRTKS